ncbi:MAG: VanW family protein [bacterium]|nr:VanW family protein [bacterium]
MRKRNKLILILSVFLLAGIASVYGFKHYFSISDIPQSALSLVTEKKENSSLPPRDPVLLGRAEVSFAGGVINRNNNIELGIARINGTVIPPGAEFSFLKTLGPVLETDGFKEAKSFYNGEVVLGLGGGLCHVSTTLFQSVLQAGLPITERHNHTFTVPYYKPGLDATISSAGPDLKFINDTVYDLTIKGYTKDKVAIFEIYGVKDGRVPKISDVEVYDWKSPPPTQFIPSRDLAVGERKCEQARQGGFTAKRIYDVVYSPEITKQQIFESTYKSLPRICHIGVDDKTDFTGCNIYTAYSRLTGAQCPKD